MKIVTGALITLGAVMLAPARGYGQAKYRTFIVETTEVTQPAIAVTPDGQSLIFTALGHLFELPARGGRATQLTFGPSYDSDPAISPDGRRVAFTSNRDGSGANIFMLELASKRVTQLTAEIEAGRAAWSPDGRIIAYTRNIPREAHALEQVPGFGDTGLRELRTIPVGGGQPTVVDTARAFETIFYLPDGRLAWSVRELGGAGMMGPQVRQTRIEARALDGSVNVLATVTGDAGRVASAPRGDGVYYSARGALQWLPLVAGATPTAGTRLPGASSRLGLTRDGGHVYFGATGGLWRAILPSGEPQRIDFSASIAMEARPRVAVAWQPPPAGAGSAALRPVMAPAFSRDGRRMIVMAAGFLFEHTLSGSSQPRRLFEGGAFMRDAAYSPDGTRLAYVASEYGKRQLRVFDFGTLQTRVLYAVGGAAWPLYPSWSPDGQQIVFQHAQNLGRPFPIVVVNVADGTTRQITQTVGSWVARPHFSNDGRWVYFTNRPGKLGTFYRIALELNATPEALTDLSRHVNEGLVSPDGRWLAIRRNSEIWVAPMSATPIRDTELRRLSSDGGRSFAFTPDASAVAYTAGGRVYQQRLAGGARTELPVRIAVARAVAPPLLITRVRPLDLTEGRFRGETSIYVEGGRIRWIGSEQGHQIPRDVVRIDGGGRFAIPGLFDAHVHSAWQNQQTNEDAFVAFGVTSVRDVGGTVDLLNALDDRADETALPAPRYFYSGEIFEGLMPLWGDAFVQVGTPDEARAEVRKLKAAGADFVKLYPSVPWHIQQAVADEAHRVSLPVVGHGLSLEEVTRRVIAGSTSLEHGNAVTGSYADLHRMLARAGTVADLTLSVFNGALAIASDPDWLKNWRVLEYVPEETRGGGRGGRGGTPLTREQALANSRGQFERIMSSRGAGVSMAGGTDALMGGVHFGLSLHWEIAQFADAGVPPIDVLRMATQGGADLVGASAHLGSLTPGKLADIVLLDANPLDNIRNTQSIWQVIKGGHVYDPARLRPGLSQPSAR